MNAKKIWTSIALVNLAIVALLGLLMRTKMVFGLPFLDFKNILQAHSHFAFGGWITLSVFILLSYELLPVKTASSLRYRILFLSVLFCSLGMLFSFPVQGYGSVSIVFSTLFIFSCWAFAFFFIRDVFSKGEKGMVRMLAVSALLYLGASAIGPFTLAWFKIHQINNFILSKDAVYTFLHLQYNGFFTLGVLALALNRIDARLSEAMRSLFKRSAWLLNASVLPSLFISYLWHDTGAAVYSASVLGALLILAATLILAKALFSMRPGWESLPMGAKLPLSFAISAFFIKQLCLALTVIPQMGALVFPNRPLIIAFLHLALLAFVSLYLISHFYSRRLIPAQPGVRRVIRTFSVAVLLNELFLFAQGLLIMTGWNHEIFAWLLWGVSFFLVGATAMLALEALKPVLRFYLSKYYQFNNKLIRYENSN